MSVVQLNGHLPVIDCLFMYILLYIRTYILSLCSYLLHAIQIPYKGYFSNSFIYKTFENFESFSEINFRNMVTDMA